MVTHYCAVNGEVSERLIAYHAERAYGGVGLNMLESTSVDDTGKSYWPGADKVKTDFPENCQASGCFHKTVNDFRCVSLRHISESFQVR